MPVHGVPVDPFIAIGYDAGAEREHRAEKLCYARLENGGRCGLALGHDLAFSMVAHASPPKPLTPAQIDETRAAIFAKPDYMRGMVKKI